MLVLCLSGLQIILNTSESCCFFLHDRFILFYFFTPSSYCINIFLKCRHSTAPLHILPECWRGCGTRRSFHRPLAQQQRASLHVSYGSLPAAVSQQPGATKRLPSGRYKTYITKLHLKQHTSESLSYSV